jgi:exonuclease VII large subunit
VSHNQNKFEVSAINKQIKKILNQHLYYTISSSMFSISGEFSQFKTLQFLQAIEHGI